MVTRRHHVNFVQPVHGLGYQPGAIRGKYANGHLHVAQLVGGRFLFREVLHASALTMHLTTWSHGIALTNPSCQAVS